jgi:hypothetical protein
MSSPQGFERKEVLARIGTFFILVGIGLLILFLLSEAAQQVTLEYFCGSIVLLVLGFIFRGQFKRPPPSSGRFGLLRRLIPKSKQDQEK